MIFPKSVNLFPSSDFPPGPPVIPLNVNPPGGPILRAPIPARAAPIPPGALAPIPIAPSDGLAPPAADLRAARLSGPDAGPATGIPAAPPTTPRAWERRRADMEVALGLGPKPFAWLAGDGADEREAAI